MAETDDLYSQVYGNAPDSTQAGGQGWTKERIISRIRTESARQGVDPDLMVALATQESYLKPYEKGDNGRSWGLFQLQEGAAKDVGIDPRWRGDPDLNIYGGIAYFKKQLGRSGGNVEQALSRYNRGTPDYRGIGDPNYVQNVFKHYPGQPTQATQQAQATSQTQARQQPGLLTRAARFLSPASAEAASPPPDLYQQAYGETPAAAPGASAGGAPGGDDLYQQVYGTSPPTATPTATPPLPEAPGSPTRPQAPVPGLPQPAGPIVAPGAQQAAPTRRLSLGDPSEAASEVEARATIEQMRQRQGLPPGSVTDPAALLAGGGAPGGVPTPVTDPAALLAVGGGPQTPSPAPQKGPSWPGGRNPYLPPGVPSIEQETLEEGITKPATMIPLLMPGAGARAGMRLVPEAWRWVGRMGGEALTQTAGELTGRAIETGQAPNWKELAQTTAWNLAPQAIEEGGRAAFRGVLRSGQGARTILSDVAAQESKDLGRRVFHPQDEQVLGKMFEDVKASGVKLDIDPVTDFFTSLKPEQRQVLLRDVKAISSPLAAALQRTGTPGAPRLTGWDIGNLQTMRSELIKRGHVVRTPERQDLINEMRMAVDDAIENGMAVGSTAAGGNPETLKAAQAGWRRLKQSDDLQALVTKHTNYSPNLQYQDLNLAALRKSLEGTNPLGRKVAASLGTAETTALQQELATLAKRYPFVKVPNTIMNIGGKVGLPGAGYLAITGNLPGAAVAASSAVVALALQSPKAMSLFRSAIVNGKGRLSSNDVAAIVNTVRQVSDVEESSGTPR